MPAVIGDPDAIAVCSSRKECPAEITPRQVILRDRVTVATLVPINSVGEVPPTLVGYLCDQLNKEIEKGDTYTLSDPLPVEKFGPFWFSNFGAVMLLGDIKSVEEIRALERNRADWSKTCLGSFNIRPNYPGRSSHICNGMFLVTDASRNRGVGRMMGECYLEWAAKLGYTYTVFNLVYETNVASCRLWDALGFKRIGRVPQAGRLRSYPDQLVDGIIYGRDLSLEGEESVTQERFDKIRYYLKYSKYPHGADRAEKSRLRSAATHYKLVGGENGEPEKLMLKDKEVVSDPKQQYEIARKIHAQQHGGINKTTATIAVKYHWVRIKETVSRVIRDCPQCRETAKPPLVNGTRSTESSTPNASSDASVTPTTSSPTTSATTTSMPTTSVPISSGVDSVDQLMAEAPSLHQPQAPPHQPEAPPFSKPEASHVQEDVLTDYTHMPLDPQIIDINQHLSRYQNDPSMGDPYDHHASTVTHNPFEEELRHHGAPDGYQTMVHDESDPDALRREALGLVNSHLNQSHHDQEIMSRYVHRSDDEFKLEFP